MIIFVIKKQKVMPRKAQKIELSSHVSDLIEKELKKRTIGVMYKKRLTAIWLSFRGVENKAISKQLSYNVNCIGVWRKRWYLGQEALLSLEEKSSKKKNLNTILLDKIKEILSDQERSGSPGHLTNKDRLRIQALACESPKDYGLPFSNWTHKSLSDTLKNMGIEISRSQVGVILKKRLTST